ENVVLPSSRARGWLLSFDDDQHPLNMCNARVACQIQPVHTGAFAQGSSDFAHLLNNEQGIYFSPNPYEIGSHLLQRRGHGRGVGSGFALDGEDVASALDDVLPVTRMGQELRCDWLDRCSQVLLQEP